MAEITVVGGINIDIEGSPFERLKYHDSNPGKVNMAFGGVGRNITENVARLGGNVAMLSVIGDDQMGLGAKAELESLGVDTSCIKVLRGENTAMYLSILDDRKDMELALCDMEIIEAITPEVLMEHKDFLRESKIVALDGNLSENLLEFAVNMLEGIPLFFDPVSAAKAIRAKKIIGKFHSIKPNVMEAEIISGMSIDGVDDLKRVGKWFIDQGVQRVFITLNKDGVYYKDEHVDGFIRPANDLKVMSATGAGDSFSAAIMLGFVQNRTTRETAKMGMVAASIAMESRHAVNKNINIEELLRRI